MKRLLFLALFLFSFDSFGCATTTSVPNYPALATPAEVCQHGDLYTVFHGGILGSPYILNTLSIRPNFYVANAYDVIGVFHTNNSAYNAKSVKLTYRLGDSCVYREGVFVCEVECNSASACYPKAVEACEAQGGILSEYKYFEGGDYEFSCKLTPDPDVEPPAGEFGEWQGYFSILKGDKGEKGDSGINGSDGDKGDKGEKGDDGVDGADGERGEKGEKGDDGIDGIDGLNGVDGLNGRNGIDGLNGSDGLDGEDGAAGVDGSHCSTQGNGDSISFICPDNTSSYDIASKEYVDAVFAKQQLFDDYKSKGCLVSGVDETGNNFTFECPNNILPPKLMEPPKGDKGEQGIQGIQGIQGEKGEQGEKGIDGNDGADGVDGINGSNGLDGINGRDGIDGRNGLNGLNGEDGKDIDTNRVVDAVNNLSNKIDLTSDGISIADKTSLNELADDNSVQWLKTGTTELEEEFKDLLTTRISSLTDTFTVNVSGGEFSERSFDVNKFGKSISVQSPLAKLEPYFSEISAVLMLLASIAAVAIFLGD